KSLEFSLVLPPHSAGELKPWISRPACTVTSRALSFLSGFQLPPSGFLSRRDPRPASGRDRASLLWRFFRSAASTCLSIAVRCFASGPRCAHLGPRRSGDLAAGTGR